MSTKFRTVITTAGAAKLAAATAPGGRKVNITTMAVGDGGGKLPVPDAGQTGLIHEVWRHALNKISQDKRNSNYIIAELVIPPEVGGFWMRELGLYDDAGTLIAVANMAESYKPALAEGSGRSQTCRMVIIVSSVASVALTIDTTTVMATQDYVDDKIAEHEQSRRHPDASLTAKGFTQLSSAINSTSETLAATPKAVKAAYDLANGKYTAQDATTARKGLVQLSSATNSTSETLAATPKAVKAAYDLAMGVKAAMTIRVTTPSTSSGGGTTSAQFTYINHGADYAPGWRRDYNTKNKQPAFALGKTGNTVANNKAVGWNWDSGAYCAQDGGASKMVLHFYTGEGSCPAMQFLVDYKNRGIFYRSARDGYGFEADWSEFYTTSRKPTPADILALALSGGSMSGSIKFINDAFLIWERNTDWAKIGFKNDSDADSDSYMWFETGDNGNEYFKWRIRSGSTTKDLMTLKSDALRVTGQVIPSNFSNFDSRYVRDLRLGGAATYKPANNGMTWTHQAPSGCVYTGIIVQDTGSNSADNIGGVYYRPVQKYINGTWYNVAQV
ncbi:phage tail protein [Escherichia coli]